MYTSTHAHSSATAQTNTHTLGRCRAKLTATSNTPPPLRLLSSSSSCSSSESSALTGPWSTLVSPLSSSPSGPCPPAFRRRVFFSACRAPVCVPSVRSDCWRRTRCLREAAGIITRPTSSGADSLSMSSILISMSPPPPASTCRMGNRNVIWLLVAQSGSKVLDCTCVGMCVCAHMHGCLCALKRVIPWSLPRVFACVHVSLTSREWAGAQQADGLVPATGRLDLARK